jgi:cytochrome P450
MDGSRSSVTFPMARQDPFHPPFEYARLRAEGPVACANHAAQPGRQLWLITRDKEARQVLTDMRFSSDSRRPGYPMRRNYSALIRMDPPEHSRYRKMLMPEFAAPQMAKLRPVVEAITNRLLDQIVKGPLPVDLVTALARPLPSLVICHILGVPYDDHGFLQDRTTEALRIDAADEEIDRAVDDLGHYMDKVVRQKLEKPGDDLLSRLIAGQVRSGSCSVETAVDLARLLLVAGHVTTVNMIGLGILTLLLHPEQLQQLRREPKLVAAAVEELLRHLSITATLSRVAIEDVEVGGTLIKAGDGVLVLLSSANRDERVYESPDRFDLHRQERGNLAFGWGPHICLGAALARLELKIVIDAVLQRLPNLQLVGTVDELRFREKVLIYGVQSLPVSWSS